jgi:sugar phosphate isomerase/epimerase
MQLDIAWACIAGKDPIQLFKANPGRYELWHIKDVFGLETVNQALSPNQRTPSMAFAPVGAGQIDYKKIFAAADVPRAIELVYQARYIGEVRHRDARSPEAVPRSRSTTRRPALGRALV